MRNSSKASKHIRTQSWSAQAHDIAANSKTQQQLSAYIYLEVKLAEALDRCDSICPPRASESGETLPNKLRTAVCCKVDSYLVLLALTTLSVKHQVLSTDTQGVVHPVLHLSLSTCEWASFTYNACHCGTFQVLTELCTISGPFSRVLSKLKDELICSIYSNYYAMEQTGLQFKQLPYYKAAERLEADNKHLTQEKDAFRKVLQRRQVCSSKLWSINWHEPAGSQRTCTLHLLMA